MTHSCPNLRIARRGKVASTGAAELAQEQAYLTMLYERLDVLKAATKQRLADGAARSDGGE